MERRGSFTVHCSCSLFVVSFPSATAAAVTPQAGRGIPVFRLLMQLHPNPGPNLTTLLRATTTFSGSDDADSGLASGVMNIAGYYGLRGLISGAVLQGGFVPMYEPLLVQWKRCLLLLLLAVI